MNNNSKINNDVFYTYEQLDDILNETIALPNCLEKYQNFYHLLHYGFNWELDSLVEKIITHLNQIPKKILGRRCTLLYYKTYLLYNFMNNSWDKAIKYIYRIHSLEYKSKEDVFFANLVLGTIYQVHEFSDQAYEILYPLYLDQETFNNVDKMYRVLFLTAIIFSHNNDSLKYISKLQSSFSDIVDPGLKKSINDIVKLEILYWQLNKCKDVTAINDSLNDYLATLKTITSFKIFNLEIICNHLYLIEALRKNLRINDAIESLYYLLSHCKNLNNRIAIYDILLEIYGENAPLKLQSQYIQELHIFYQNEMNYYKKQITKEVQIREYKEKMNQMFIELSCDSLTGCISKNRFEKLIGEYLETNQGCTLVYFDIDDLRTINQVYGRETGDEIIKLLADKIRNRITSNGLLCRYGNDEFILVIPDMDKNFVTDLVLKIESDFYDSDFFKTNDVLCVFSYGIAIYDSDYYETPMKLIIKAEQLLDEQRRKRKL